MSTDGATTRTPLTDALVALFDRTRPVRRAARTPLTDALIDAALRQVRREDPPSAYAELRDQPIDVLIAHARRMEGDRAELVEALERLIHAVEYPYLHHRIRQAKAALVAAKESP